MGPARRAHRASDPGGEAGEAARTRAEAAIAVRSARLAAITALALALLAAAGAVAIAVGAFPRGLFVVGFVIAACPLAWYGILRRGVARWVSLGVAALLLAAALAMLILIGPFLAELAVVVVLALALSAGRAAFAVKAQLPPAPRPQRPVLIWNPRSGDGKAERCHLEDEARARGIACVELKPGDDLNDLVREAIAGGADALAMAGGDGSQALVAAAAARAGLPYACIPAGTRNHFALDLGVDRDDVVGALDALVRGGERRVDLAEVNGRVFVNNVSLGVYADAVQQEGYREAKLRTIFNAVPDELGPDGRAPDLRWTGPDGTEHASGAVILVSNNPYRLRALDSGTRPRLDTGELGVAVMADSPGDPRGGALRQWSTPTFEIRSSGGVPAGVDGEALVLDPPLRFVMRPGALAVRIAPQHPGASPSAALPDGAWEAVRALARIAEGHAPEPR